MKRHLLHALLLATLSALTAMAQTSSTAPLSGSVLDPTGAVISNAGVSVKNNATGQEFKAATSSNGTFTIPALGAGVYTVTIEASGFKKAVVQEVKIDAATPATVNVTLEVGVSFSVHPTEQGGVEV